MLDLEARNQAFISGFFEDIAILQNHLPDDLVLWLIDELCWEQCDVLRNCYINILYQSPNQIQRLLCPELIKNLFLHLNGTLEGTNIKNKIQLVEEIPECYSYQNWSALLSTLKLFAHVADTLSQEAKIYLTCMLLRMSADISMIKNVDIFCGIQKTLENLCKYTSFLDWKQFCQETCESVYRCIEQPALRLQVVESLSSVTMRSHDLKRRLASCFLFNNLIFAKKPSQEYYNFPMFLNRLQVSDFKCKSDTDFHDLRALVKLMDIAIDDGQSSHLNLDNELEEEEFNDNIEKLGKSVKEIFGGPSSQDNGSISKIQAKEVVEAFSRRITHTMRTKPKLVHEWFVDRDRERRDVKERQAMENFVAKVKGYKKEN